MRNAGTPGKYNAPGMPDAQGACYPAIIPSNGSLQLLPIESPSGVFSGATTSEQARGMFSTTGADSTKYSLGIKLALSNGSDFYGAADTVMPASADITVGIYLGRSAKI